MKKTACQYAIVRFTPFIETGEFANVGIIMMAPNARYFGFKLLTKRHGRITKFFEEMDAKVFRSTMYALKEELERVHVVLKSHGFDRRYKTNDVEFAKGLFAEVVRPRETILRFSEPRAVLTDDPKETLKELFAYYVERDFVTKEYRETVLEKGMRRLLLKEQLGERFTRERIGDDEYKVLFPFVEMHEKVPARIIKPLNLGQDDSSKIIEHGGKWEFRMRELRKRHMLPDKVLFAVDGPGDEGRRGSAYREVVDMLTDTGVAVLPYENQEQILDFALDRLSL
ncbi:DUF3037 domain-containing protein [bacterium endosymbiont of Escarpia laminata]|nr:MAG: DUF3037 domain-containing protein [bacterium endosymbiont of Escarpia laminata]